MSVPQRRCAASRSSRSRTRTGTGEPANSSGPAGQRSCTSFPRSSTTRSTSRRVRASHGHRARPTRRCPSASCSTPCRAGPRPSPRCARPPRPALAGRTTGGCPMRLGSPRSRATRCSCTRTTSPSGSTRASIRLATFANACSHACSPGRRPMETRGRFFAGRTAAWRYGSDPGSPPVGCPIPPRSTSGTAGTPTRHSHRLSIREVQVAVHSRPIAPGIQANSARARIPSSFARVSQIHRRPHGGSGQRTVTLRRRSVLKAQLLVPEVRSRQGCPFPESAGRRVEGCRRAQASCPPDHRSTHKELFPRTTFLMRRPQPDSESHPHLRLKQPSIGPNFGVRWHTNFCAKLSSSVPKAADVPHEPEPWLGGIDPRDVHDPLRTRTREERSGAMCCPLSRVTQSRRREGIPMP
jgi:hypothetical protein